jgi:hypothetical protein
MQSAAAEYAVQTDAGKELPLHTEPLLRFNNPVSGVPDGIVVAWLDGRRPAILAQVFQTKDGLWIQECQSIARVPLAMRHAGEIRWQPRTGADEWVHLDNGPLPAPTAVGRLAQMRSIAGQFSGSDDFKISASDAEPTRHELRMLPRPVYRYSDESAGIPDGAVFAFVHGTDPEVFLVLEARVGTEAPDWYYTFAPMTCWGVHVRRGEGEVWSVEERYGKSSERGLYHVWVHSREVAP